MDQQPDKLFRKKLTGFHKSVPSTAWSRVEEKLNKKNNNKLWLKYAASLMLLSAAAFLLWPKNEITNNAPGQVSQNITNKLVKPLPLMKKENILPDKPITEELNTTIKKRVRKEKRSIIKHKSNQEPETTQKANLNVITEPKENNNDLTGYTRQENETISANEPLATEHAIIKVSNIQHEDVGVTIVYTAEEVNEKYLNKKSLAEATSDEAKPSTLKNLLKKAYTLSDQDPLGDLRQKKNEILALNFRSEKQRNQNE